MNLESQVVEKAVEISKPDKKRKASSTAKKGKAAQGGAKKGKRPQSAFFLFMKDFREEYKVAHPDEKGVAAVGKAGGEKWRSMTDEEKKPYFDKAEELKAQIDNGEGSAEKVVQPVNLDSDPEDDVVEQEEEPEEEENELDDDI